MPTEVEYAWAAGFIEGEGCFFSNGVYAVQLRITQVNLEPLTRLQAIIGGRINGPYNPPSHRGKPYYQYSLRSSYLKAHLRHMWNHLSETRQNQYLQQVDKVS